MELTQMRYFLEVAQTQHITRSAQKLHIVQPALTKAIHKLEEELGVPLFTRKGRNIVLTQYGTYLRDKLTPVMKSIDDIGDNISQMVEVERHTVRLSVLAASTIITQAIIEYRKKYPDVNFYLLQNPDDELFDVEITTNLFYNNKTDSEMNRFVCTEKIFLAVPDNNKYKDKTSISLADVKNEGFISLSGSKQLRTICEKFCHHAGFEPNIIFESDSPYAVKNMIAANLGVGFWPEFSWGRINNSTVKLMEITDPVCRRDILVTYRDIKTDNSYSLKFFEFLKAYLQEKKL